MSTQSEVVESVTKLDPAKGDVLLVKVKVELNPGEQYEIATQLKHAFPGVHIFLAGPSADIEVVRDKLRKGWRGKEETDGEGTQ